MAGPEQGASLSLREVYIVEDTRDNAIIMAEALRVNGYAETRFRIFNDVEEARREIAISQPGLILLDLRVVGQDVTQILKERRDNPQLQNTIVIVVTGDELEPILRKSLREAGVDEFITKPFDIDEFAETVKRVLAIRQL